VLLPLYAGGRDFRRGFNTRFFSQHVALSALHIVTLGLDPRVQRGLDVLWMVGSSPTMTKEKTEISLLLQRKKGTKTGREASCGF
jgi:hypothetical protein